MTKIILYLFLSFSGMYCFAQPTVKNPVVEHLSNPIGLDSTVPRFSWQMGHSRRNVSQTAYEIRVGSSRNLALQNNTLWTSGRVKSDSSINIGYKGPPLRSGQKYFWQVRICDNFGTYSKWGDVQFFQMALMSTSDWKAKWIEAVNKDANSSEQIPPIFRKVFHPQKKISSATAYITAHGLYEAKINGIRVGTAILTPGWTSYNKRLQYQVYDVTKLIKTGSNAIGIGLGNGWYKGNLINPYRRNIYGKTLGLLFQLELKYEDGSTELVTSDNNWKSSTSSIQFSEIYHGETIDATKEKTGWETAEYDDSDWNGVKVIEYPMNNLVATLNEPIRKQELLKPIRIFKSPKGEDIIDFGQNLTGWVTVKVIGKRGDSIKINHAEVLDKEGNFYTENLRSAKAEDNYILKGGETETFEPHFTFHGFRYIKISGFKSPLKPEDFTAVALYSDMKPTGTFTSSNPDINQLQQNIQWGQKGNFLDIPSDCPQRDERLGWTGDAQVFAKTAAFNMDVNQFFRKWLKDLAADQGSDGKVPNVIPQVLNQSNGGAAGWGDAAVIIPWEMYQSYGDQRILVEQYQSMKAWVNYISSESKDHLWNKGYQFGDWLAYMIDNDLEGRSAITDKYMIAQCFYAHSTQLLINTAKVLNRQQDVNQYSILLQNIKDAFMREYVTTSGRLVSNTQTAYVLALQFDMFPENLQQQAVGRLVENIKSYKDHLSTGFLGTPYICQVLSRFGETETAYRLLLQETFPSWLYPVKMGATTIWERWNGIKPDGSFETSTMNSFNHYAYGAIGDWLYSEVTGLNNEEGSAGYKKIIIRPRIGGNLTHATSILQSRYGKILSGWKIQDGQLIMNIEIPPNTTAAIFVPTQSILDVMENGKAISSSKEIISEGISDGYLKLRIGSGNYNFSSKWSKNKETQ